MVRVTVIKISTRKSRQHNSCVGICAQLWSSI